MISRIQHPAVRKNQEKITPISPMVSRYLKIMKGFEVLWLSRSFFFIWSTIRLNLGSIFFGNQLSPSNCHPWWSGVHALTVCQYLLLLFCLCISWITLTSTKRTLFQVRLMNYTHTGNNFVIRWAIVPAESANCFSNTKAMVIGLLVLEYIYLQLEPFPYANYSFKLILI